MCATFGSSDIYLDERRLGRGQPLRQSRPARGARLRLLVRARARERAVDPPWSLTVLRQSKRGAALAVRRDQGKTAEALRELQGEAANAVQSEVGRTTEALGALRGCAAN